MAPYLTSLNSPVDFPHDSGVWRSKERPSAYGRSTSVIPSTIEGAAQTQGLQISGTKVSRRQPWIGGSYNPGWVQHVLDKSSNGCGKAGFMCGLLVNSSETQEQREKIDWETLSLEGALTSMEGMPQLPSIENLTCILHRCRTKKNLAYTKRLYSYICKRGLEDHRSLGNYLVPMLVQVGSMCDAQQAFNKLVDRNVYSWTSLIMGYIDCGESQHALNLYRKMQEDSVNPSTYTFVALLKASARLKDAESGQEIHAEIARTGLERNLFVGSSLVDMYAKCGSLPKAQEAFDKLSVRDIVSWNALVAGYAEHGFGEEALNYFKQMRLEGLSPDAATFVCSLKGCGSIRAIDEGSAIHSEIARNGLERDLVIGNSLVDMYAKSGALAKAQVVFDKLPVQNKVSWTALIAGYAEHGLGEEALSSFEQMQLEGLSPDAITLVCSLKACRSIGAIDKGQEIHAQIARMGLERDDIVGNILVDMYAKSGFLVNAWEVCDKLPVRDVVSWNVLMTGFAERGLGEEALDCFELLQLEDLSPDDVTFICCLKASGSIGTIDKGKVIHAEIVKRGLERGLFVGNATVDMYAKCGSLEDAREVFDMLPIRDAVSWNALIAGYAQLTESEIIYHMLEKMRGEQINPDRVTFSVVLTVCSHMGLVDKGKNYFEAMSKDYGITPMIEHYTVMINLLGRAGQLDEAVAMAKKMPFHPDLAVWHSVLGACQKWGNVELGRLAFEQALQLDEKDAAAHVLMSNIYAHKED